MRKSSTNLFIHSQAKKKKSQSISYHQLQRCNNYIERFYSEQCISEPSTSAPPKSAQRQSQQQQMKSEKKVGGEMYLPFLIAQGSICGNIPVIYQISKKFNCLLDCAVHKSCTVTHLCITEGSEKDCIQFFFLSPYYPPCEFHSK